MYCQYYLVHLQKKNSIWLPKYRYLNSSHECSHYFIIIRSLNIAFTHYIYCLKIEVQSLSLNDNYYMEIEALKVCAYV